MNATEQKKKERMNPLRDGFIGESYDTFDALRRSWDLQINLGETIRVCGGWNTMKPMVSFGFPEEWRDFERRQSEFITRFRHLQELIVLAFPTVELSEPADRVIYFLVRTCVEDFQEILLLCGNSYGIAAEKLLRGMYERAVTAAYLHRCPEEGQNFLDYEKVSQHKLLKAVEDSISNDVFRPEQREQIERCFELVKEKFMVESCKTCKSRRLNHTWSRLDFVSMARTSGELWKLLVPAYYMGLREGHSTTGSIFSRLDPSVAAADQGLIFGGELQPKRADAALSIAHHILLIALGLQGNHFKLTSLNKPLDTCMEDLLEILKSQRTGDKRPT